MPSKKLPPDVSTQQVWKDTAGQHYYVLEVVGKAAKLNRCSPAGRVLNQKYVASVLVETMQSEWTLVTDPRGR